MKKIKILFPIIALFMTVGLYGQQYIFNNSDTIKSNVYDSKIIDVFLHDSAIYTNGSFYSAPDLKLYKFLNKYDLNGNLLLSKIFLDTANSGSSKMNKCILANNNIINAEIKDDSMDYLVITSYTLNFDTNWSVQYPSTFFNQSLLRLDFVDIIQTPDNGFLIGVNAWTTFYLLKIGSNGNFQWKKTYTSINVIKLAVTPDLGIMMVTEYYPRKIIKTNALGTILWQRQLNTIGLDMILCDLKKLDNNHFLFCTTYERYYNDYSYYGIYIMKIRNSDGSIIWQKKHNPFATVFGHDIDLDLDLHIVNNGNFYISYLGGISTNSQYALDYVSVLQAFNSFGDSLGINIFKLVNSQTNYCESLIGDGKFYSDGSFIGGGMTSGCFQNNIRRQWLFRTSPITTSMEEYSSSNDIKITPNPSRGLFNIQNIKSFKSSNISVYNLNGQLLKQIENVYGNSLQIDLSEYPAGMYLLGFENKDGLTTYSKIIIEK